MDTPFIELVGCPDCAGDVHPEFFEDSVQLRCSCCQRVFGAGADRAEARTLCSYWNLLLGEPGDAAF